MSLSDEENSRLNLEVSNAKVYVVSEGYKTPKEVWDPEADLKKAFTNGFNFFPNTYKPDEDKNGNGVLDPGEDFYSFDPATGKNDYKKLTVSLTNLTKTEVHLKVQYGQLCRFARYCLLF